MAEPGNQSAANKNSRRLLTGAAMCACLLASIWTYDALGYQQAVRFETDHEKDPVAVLENWRGYQRWHPLRNVLPFSPGRGAERRVVEVQVHVGALQAAQKLVTGQQRAQLAYDRLTRAEAEGTDLVVLLTQCDETLREFPGSKVEAELR